MGAIAIGRRSVASLLTVLILLASAQPSLVAAAKDRQLRESGVEIVGLDPLQSMPSKEAQAIALDEAYWYAVDHPADIGYPWLDGEKGVLHLAASSSRGGDLLEAYQLEADASGATLEIRAVPRSIAELDSIRDGVIALTRERFPGWQTIVQTEPDEIDGRIVITLNQMDDSLITELARRFGTEAIAVRVIPGFQPEASIGGRQADWSPFFGGARIHTPDATCSSGFPWVVVPSAGTEGMLTAAHCIPNGGTVSSAVTSMGTVTSGSRENWKPNDGTVPFTGQTELAGDLALVQMASGKGADPKIYRGSASSASWDWVTAIWSRSPAIGDQFHISNQQSGDIGPYTVSGTHLDVFYLNASAWARNVTRADRTWFPACPSGGSSGGAVFTNRNDGSVAAKGIHSGVFTDWITCWVWFTDIRLADQYLPGFLLTH